MEEHKLTICSSYIVETKPQYFLNAHFSSLLKHLQCMYFFVILLLFQNVSPARMLQVTSDTQKIRVAVCRFVKKRSVLPCCSAHASHISAFDH